MSKDWKAKLFRTKKPKGFIRIATSGREVSLIPEHVEEYSKEKHRQIQVQRHMTYTYNFGLKGPKQDSQNWLRSPMPEGVEH